MRMNWNMFSACMERLKNENLLYNDVAAQLSKSYYADSNNCHVYLEDRVLEQKAISILREYGFEKEALPSVVNGRWVRMG